MPLVFAWFSNPLMLWGLGAASVPLIIHLLNRRRYREVPWAAMRFLLAALQKNQKRVRIEQWLLLAVRTLLVIAVVLAMAKPFLESLGATALLPGQRTHWVLALDGSLSMGFKPGDATRFEHAKELAGQLAKAARPGDGVSVVLLGDPPRAIIGAPAFRREAVESELDTLQPTDGAIDLTASFAKIDEVLAASDIRRKELVVLTDLQASSWNRKQAEGDEGLKRLVAKLGARKVRSSVIDLGSARDVNRAVTGLRLDPPVVTRDVPATVQALVRNFGREPAPGVKVRLVVDGRLVEETTADLGSGEERAVAFLQSFADPGEHVVEVQLDADELKGDDARRLVVPVREAVRVLIVDGDPKPEALKSESAFLAEALSPASEGDEPPVSPVRVDIIGESQLAGMNLESFDAVVLCNVARVTPAEAAALDGLLRLGGGVVVFLGDQVVADNYNQILFAEGKGLLPAELVTVVGQGSRTEKPFEFDPLGFRHPLVGAFAGEAPGVTASLTNVKTARYVRTKLPNGSAARVALGFSSGDPAVIEAPRARGRVVLVTTSADAEWTSWPLHQSFPPVMEQAILQAASGRAAERNVRVGQPLVEAFPAGAVGASASVARPAGPAAATRLAADGEISLLRYDATDLAGVYRARIGPPVDAEVAFAANPDAGESDPARLDATALRAAVPGWDFVYESNWRPLTSNAGAVGHRGELHRPLLWAVLGLLFFESLLAWYFGHNPARAR